MLVWQSLLGLIVLTTIAWAIGGGRAKAPVKTVVGILL